MNLNQSQKVILCTLSVCTLILVALSCSSGGSSVAHTTIQGTGSGTGSATSTVSGQISSFGSIYVSGIKFNTDSISETTLDGETGDLTSLAPGMVVTVTGSVDDDRQNGTATSITFSSHLAGPIQDYNSTSKTFSIHDITVTIDQGTNYQTGLSLAQIVDGLSVVVSGVFTDDDAITATYISRNPKNFSHSRSHDDLNPSINSDQVISIAGRVEAPTKNSIRVRKFVIRITPETEITGSRRDLKGGEHVHIFGKGINSNTIEAEHIRVEAKDIDFDEIEGNVEAIDKGNRTITVANTVYNTTHFTQYLDEKEDDEDSEDMRFGLDDLQVGQNVELQLETDINDKQVIRTLVRK